MADMEIDVFNIHDINVLRDLFLSRNQERDDIVRENLSLKRTVEQQEESNKRQNVVHSIGWKQTGKWMMETWKAKERVKAELFDNKDLKPEEFQSLEEQRDYLRVVIRKFTKHYPQFKEEIEGCIADIHEKDQRKQAIARLSEEQHKVYLDQGKEKEKKNWIDAWIRQNPTFLSLPIRPKPVKEKKEKKSKVASSSTDTLAPVSDNNNDPGSTVAMMATQALEEDTPLNLPPSM